MEPPATIPPLSLREKKELGLVERPPYFAFQGVSRRKWKKKATTRLQEHCICLEDEKPEGKKKQEACSMRGGEELKEFTPSH